MIRLLALAGAAELGTRIFSQPFGQAVKEQIETWRRTAREVGITPE